MVYPSPPLQGDGTLSAPITCNNAVSGPGGCDVTQIYAADRVYTSGYFISTGTTPNWRTNDTWVATDGVPSGDSRPSFIFYTTNIRDGGPLVEFDNAQMPGPAFQLDPLGNLLLSNPRGTSDPNGSGQLIDNSGVNAHTTITAKEGFNVTIKGSEPTSNQGMAQGNLVIGNNHGFDAGGMIVEINNSFGGVGSNSIVADIDYLGGYSQFYQNRRLADFGQCPGIPTIVDGRAVIYGQTLSTLMWNSDPADQSWYVCTASGWRRMMARAGTVTLACGSNTVPIDTNSTCVCVDQTAVHAVECIVIGTTLMVHGADSDVVGYVCGWAG